MRFVEDLRVSCYSGHTYAQRPESFLWHGKEYEVKGIEKTWQEPGRKCFQVRSRDNKLFQLCYNESRQRWSITEPVEG